MIQTIKKDTKLRMEKSLESLATELTRVRTGRAHPSLLDHITVDFYGSEVPIGQAANVSNSDARTLSIQVWDKTMAPIIEKAIINSDLGLTPTSAGEVIRINMPPLTEERRKDLTKVVRSEGENAKIAIRNIRRDANGKFKNLLTDKEISEDEERQAEGEIQTITDEFIKKIDVSVAAKEKDLMEI